MELETALKIRAQALGCTNQYKFAKAVLELWIDQHFHDFWVRQKFSSFHANTQIQFEKYSNTLCNRPQIQFVFGKKWKFFEKSASESGIRGRVFSDGL